MTQSYKNLKGNQAIFLFPDNIKSMMTSIRYARQTCDGTIILTYTDSTEEQCKFENMPELSEMTIFDAVGLVQSRR